MALIISMRRGHFRALDPCETFTVTQRQPHRPPAKKYLQRSTSPRRCSDISVCCTEARRGPRGAALEGELPSAVWVLNRHTGLHFFFDAERCERTVLEDGGCRVCLRCLSCKASVSPLYFLPLIPLLPVGAAGGGRIIDKAR